MDGYETVPTTDSHLGDEVVEGVVGKQGYCRSFLRPLGSFPRRMYRHRPVDVCISIVLGICLVRLSWFAYFVDPAMPRMVPLSEGLVPKRYPRYAITTLLAGDRIANYIQYAVKLGRSITMFVDMDMILFAVKIGNTTELWGALDALAAAGWDVRTMKHIGSWHDRTTIMYNKLYCWTLIEYEAVVYLDSDMMVVQDISPLFDYWLPVMRDGNYTLAAVHDEPSQFNLRYSTYHNINGGMFMLIPSMDTFHYLQYGLDRYDMFANDLSNQDDQIYLTRMLGSSLLFLPSDYNAMIVVAYAEPFTWMRGNPRIIHFTIMKPLSANLEWWPGGKVFVDFWKAF